jgi:hypothetical protein
MLNYKFSILIQRYSGHSLSSRSGVYHNLSPQRNGLYNKKHLFDQRGHETGQMYHMARKGD